MANKAETREWNNLHDIMKSFHARFEAEFTHIYEAADKHGKDVDGLKRFLRTAGQLDSHLRLHHSIEDMHIFPVLAQRMPEFAKERPEEHEAIHEGLDRYAAYLRDALAQPHTYDPTQLRAVMDSFRQVLFTHMAQEVQSLKGANLQKYWTLDEVRKFPI